MRQWYAGHPPPKKGAHMRKIMFLLGVLTVPSFSLAQNNPDWSNLTKLHAGQQIQIVETNSQKHPGTFVSASDTSLVYRETAGEHSIEKQDVQSVKLIEHQRRPRPTLIGAAIGAGAGAGIAAAAWEDHGFLGGKGVGA